MTTHPANESAHDKYNEQQEEMHLSEDPTTNTTHARFEARTTPVYVQEAFRNLHPTKVWKTKGGGFCLPSYDLSGCSILDLGCEDGRDVYITSQLVGQNGRVVGVDMSIEQLDEAEEYQDYHAEKFGFKNTEFVYGNLETLDEIESLEKGSFDVITSNYVVNLCDDKVKVLKVCHDLLKPGGEMYIMDLFTNRRVPVELQQNLQSGPLYWNDFLNMAKSAGFGDPRLVDEAPISPQNKKLGDGVSCDENSNLKIYSATYRLYRIDELEPSCEDYGQAVVYKGTIPHHEMNWSLDKGYCFEKARAQTVCGNTWYMLEKNPKLKLHFDFVGDFSTHYGSFVRVPVTVTGMLPMLASTNTPSSDSVTDKIQSLGLACDAESTAQVLHELRVLSRDENKRLAISAAGGIQCIVDAMRKHAENPTVQEEGCAALNNMACKNNANQVFIVSNGGMQCILNAMRQHANHTGIQKYGCHALSNLASNVSGNRVSFTAAGGIQCILNAMRRHVSVDGIQEPACAALASLAFNTEQQVLIAVAGGIQCVLDAMRQHINHSGVQAYGCWVLRNLAATKSNVVTVGIAGGIQCILNAMRRHSYDARIQKQGCGALFNLSTTAKNRLLLRASGAVQVVQNAHRNFPRESVIKKTLRKMKWRYCF